MSLADDILQAGLESLESDQSDAGTSPQITVGGLVWPCVKGGKKAGKVFQGNGGGFTFAYDFEIHIRKNALSTDGSLFSAQTLPVSGDEATVDGTVYRIEFVDEGQGAYVALFLMDKNK